MNKGIALTLALLAMTSCSKVKYTEPDLSLTDASRELNFVVAKAKASTKADEFNGTEFLDKNGFGAYAWYTGDEVSKYWMNAVNIIKQTEGGTTNWKPVTPYYWPKEHTLDFICFAPYNGGSCWFTISDNPDNAASNGKANRITAHQKVSRSTEDLLFSDKAIRCSSSAIKEVSDGVNAYSGVPTIFRHSLAKANFKIKVDTLFDQGQKVFAKVTFKQASLKNVHNEGVLTLDLLLSGSTASTRQWNTEDGVWDVSQYPETIDIPDDIGGATQVYSEPLPFIADIFLMPQILEKQSIYVEVLIELYETEKFEKNAETGKVIIDQETGMPLMYVLDEHGQRIKITPDNPLYTKPHQKENIRKEKLLKEITGIAKWRMGNNIDYTITVAPFTYEITFDPAIDVWLDVSGGMII